MLEALIALGVVVALMGVAFLAMAPPLTLAWVSLGLTLLGVVVGVPAGVYYHLVLRAELMRHTSLPPRWYWYPHRYHSQLEGRALARVLLWFRVGGSGFLLTVVGFMFGVMMLFRMQ